MAGYIVRRVLQALVVLWGAHLVSFLLLLLLPSDAAAIKVATSAGLEAASLTPEVLETARAELGLAGTPMEIYLRNLGDLLTGDWGRSFQTGKPVALLVGEALPHTLALAGTALAIAVTGGVLLGLLVGYTRSPRLRELLLSLPPLAASVPAFAIGVILIQVFAFTLRLLPAGGVGAPGSLVLPALTLAIPIGATIAQVFARVLVANLHQPYVDTAIARGAGRLRVVWHALVNTLGPTLALLGVIVGGLFGGAVITETVFSRTGLGRITVDAVQAQDLPVIQVVVVFAALVFVLTTLLVDLVHPIIDRRVARERSAV